MLISGRKWLRSLMVVCIGLAVFSLSSGIATSEVRELHIAINKSPWFPAFERLVRMYEEKTGMKVVLHAFPFEGLYEKELTVVTTGSKDFDLMNMNEYWGAYFYSSGSMTPIKEIDPEFEAPSHLIEFSWEGYWDSKVHYQAPTGTLYGIPVNGNIHLFQYREDKYKKAGFSTPPETWDDVLEAAQKLHNPPNFYGYVNRGFRGDPIFYNSTTIRHSYGGYIFADPFTGDFTITVNDEKNREAIEMYARKLVKYAPPGVGNINQAELMGLLASGKALQAVAVAASWPHYDDPNFSRVPFKVRYAVPPKAKYGEYSSTVAMWTMAIPQFISEERKKAALDFLKWSITKEAQVVYTKLGAVPISKTVFESELMGDPKYRFLKAMQDSLAHLGSLPLIPELPQIKDAMGLHLNKCLIREESVEEALDRSAQEILDIMKKAGYKGVSIASKS